jgi:hypothetical protein
MSDPSIISNLAKAADIAKSLTSDALRNVPMLIALFLALLFIAILPDRSLPKEMLTYRWIVTGACVFIGSYVLLQWWFAWRPVRKLKWHCENLATDEREILASYLKEDAACEYFFAFHGPVCSLIAKGVLTFASNMFDAFEAPVMINPHVRLYLRKKPDLVGLKTADLGTIKPRGRLKTKSLLPEQ